MRSLRNRLLFLSLLVGTLTVGAGPTFTIPMITVRTASIAANNVSKAQTRIFIKAPTAGQAEWVYAPDARNQKLAEGALTDAVKKGACEVLTGTDGDDPLEMHLENCRLLAQSNEPSLRATTGDPSADRAYANTYAVLYYYATVLGQVGLEGEGKPVSAVVHLASHYDNAYWDPEMQAMAYGDGAPDEREPAASTHDYTLARDVSGHEMTHGVISKIVQTHRNRKIDPGLNGSFENGALNEAIADIEGILFNRWHVRIIGKRNPDQPYVTGGAPAQAWTFGQRAYKRSNSNDPAAQRKRSNDLSFRPLDDSADQLKAGRPTHPGKNYLHEDDYGRDGASAWHKFPTKYSEVIRCDGTTLAEQPILQRQVSTGNNDYCNVHANAVLIGHLAYLLSNEITREDLFRGAINDEAAVAKLFFEAAKRHLEPDGDFHQMAASLVSTCNELASENPRAWAPQTCAIVHAGLKQVELE